MSAKLSQRPREILCGGTTIGDGRCGFCALFQQKAAQGAQVVEKAAAVLEMGFELGKFELDQLQGLEAAFEVGLGRGRLIGIDLLLGLTDRIQQQPDVLMRILDAIKRGVRRAAQMRLPCLVEKSGGEGGI